MSKLLLPKMLEGYVALSKFEAWLMKAKNLLEGEEKQK